MTTQTLENLYRFREQSLFMTGTGAEEIWEGVPKVSSI